MSDEERLWGIDTVKITNGIDVKAIREHKYSGDKNKINLIAVSFESQSMDMIELLGGLGNITTMVEREKLLFTL